MAKLVTLIESEQIRGRGVNEDPRRTVKQWFTPDGELIAENDPWLEEAKIEAARQRKQGEQ